MDTDIDFCCDACKQDFYKYEDMGKNSIYENYPSEASLTTNDLRELFFEIDIYQSVKEPAYGIGKETCIDDFIAPYQEYPGNFLHL